MTHSSLMNDPSRPDPMQIVRAFMAREELSIALDDAAAWIGRPSEWSVASIVDRVMLELGRVKLGSGDIARAARQIVREDQRGRVDGIMLPLLFARLDMAEQVKAQDAWKRLVEAILHLEAALGVAVLRHFVWQVKCKALGRPVYHHLMPVNRMSDVRARRWKSHHG